MANRVETVITAESKSAIKQLKALKKEVNSLGSSVDSLGGKFNNSLTKASLYGAAQRTAILGWIGAIKNSAQAMINATKASSNYAESLNLLNVAYNQNTDSATKLIDKMSTMYGLDPANLTKQLGIYKQMTNAMGMTNKQSALLSENLLKMQEDVSSLYNLDVEEVGRKFQSALAGQTRAVRSLGVDITKASLQQELYARGINKKYNELNRASKSALIYLAMERQMKKANGDAANTIEHLANQLRIFKEQLAIAARQIGGVFIPVIQAILPYLNGVLMALNEIGKALLGLMGVDINEMAKTSGISVATSDLDDLGDSIDAAGNKAKKLKNQLRGFDKLNVITTPTKDSGSGSASGGGIDSELLKQLKEYDLKDVSMRANEIKEAFKEWLKVFKPLEEPLKNLANLTFDGLKYLWTDILQPIGKWANETLLPKIVEVLATALDAVYQTAKTLSPILLVIMENVVKPFGRILGKQIINILNAIKWAFEQIAKNPILQYLIGATGLIFALKKLYEVAKNVYLMFGTTKLGKVLNSFDGMLIQSVKETKSLTKGWQSYVGAVTSGSTKMKKVIESAKLGFKGLVDAGLGLLSVVSAIQDINENGFNVINTITLIVGAIMTIKGAIEITTAVVAIFNATLVTMPIVGIIGALIGAGGFIAALALTQQEINKNNDELEKYKQKMQEIEEETQKMYQNTEAQIGIAQNYQTELSNLVDENGRVKGSYNDVDKALAGLNDTLDLNIERKGDHLYVNGELIKTQKKLNEIIDNTINKLKEETIVEMAKKKIEPVYERRSELLTKEKNQIELLKEEAKKYNLQDENGYNDFIKNNVGRIRELQTLQGELKTNQNQLDTYYNGISEAEKGNFDNALTLIGTTAQSTQSNIIDTMNTLDLELADGWETTVDVKLNLNDAEYKRKLNQIKMEEKNLELYGSTDYKGFKKPTKKADGGFLTTGEMFIAREAGPELVGRIGNKTAVANNDQIVNSIAKGLAMSGIGKDTNVNIVAKGDVSGLLDFITFEQQKRNRQYGL